MATVLLPVLLGATMITLCTDRHDESRDRPHADSDCLQELRLAKLCVTGTVPPEAEVYRLDQSQLELPGCCTRFSNIRKEPAHTPQQFGSTQVPAVALVLNAVGCPGG